MTHTASLTNVHTGAPSEVAAGVVGLVRGAELRSGEGEREWLLTGGRGTFALGTVDRALRRKYHTVLSVGAGSETAQNLVAEVIERLVVGDTPFCLLPLGGDAETTSKRPTLQSFTCRDSAVWIYELGPVRLRRELTIAPETDCITIRYELSGDEAVDLQLEPLLLFRSIHGVSHKDIFLDGRVREDGGAFSIAPYAGTPRLHMAVSGGRARFEQEGAFRELVHEWEGARGYERGEFAFSPGSFRTRLAPDEPVVLTLGAGPAQTLPTAALRGPSSGVRGASFASILERSLRAHLITSPRGRVVVGGYPWFGASLRETLLVLPGLSAIDSSAFIEVLESVGLVLAGGASGSGHGRGAEGSDSVDVPLLFIRAVQIAARTGHGARALRLTELAESVLRGWINGNHPRVQLSGRGLLHVAPGPWALTWMNATVDGLPVTPRSGYAVDVNALFVNALVFLSRRGISGEAAMEPWASLHATASAAFLGLFRSPAHAHLADCHDGRTADFSLRPNQLWAAALPHSPLSRDERLAVVDTVREHLLTDVGIRTLSPRDARYAGRCVGDQRSRDEAVHQGSAWPFLLGLYADALAELGQLERLREDTAPVLARLERHVRSEACLGHVSELFDGDAPHEPRGAPAHAASVAELLRVARMVER